MVFAFCVLGNLCLTQSYKDFFMFSSRSFSLICCSTFVDTLGFSKRTTRSSANRVYFLLSNLYAFILFFFPVVLATWHIMLGKNCWEGHPELFPILEEIKYIWILVEDQFVDAVYQVEENPFFTVPNLLRVCILTGYWIL